MVEFAQKLEQIASYLEPTLLVLPGLAGLMLGLLVWLAGLNLRKILLGIVAAVAIATAALICSSDILVGFFGFLFGLIAATIFERTFTALMASGLAAALAFFIIIGPELAEHPSPEISDQYPPSQQTQILTIQQSGRYMEAYADAFAVEIAEIARELAPGKWTIIAIITILVGIGAILLRTAVLSASFALTGTALIFISMISLLLYKGSEPISYIIENSPHFGVVFIAMTAFGTISQIFLCQWPPKKKKSNEKTEQKTEAD